MAFFKSNKIKVFPCTYRGKNSNGVPFNPEARLNTEANFTLLSKLGTGFDRRSHIISWEFDVLKVVIGGYYFEIEATQDDLLNIEGFDTYLHIHLLDKTIVTGSHTTTVLKDLNSEDYNYNNLDSELQDDYYFTGLEYFKDSKTPLNDDNDIYLTIFKNGRLCYDNFLPKLDTLNDERLGLNVIDLEIYNKEEDITTRNSTANWLDEHTSTDSRWLSTKTVVHPNTEKNKHTLDFDLNFDLKDEIKFDSKTSIQNATTSVGYYAVEAISDDLGLKKPLLAVSVPKTNNWRPIYIDGNRAYTTDDSDFPLYLVSGDNISLNHKVDYTTSGKQARVIVSGVDSYLEPAYNIGLKLNNHKKGNAQDLVVPYMDENQVGVARVCGVADSDVAINDYIGGVARNYGVRLTPDKKLYVNVPWVNYDDTINNIKIRLENLESHGAAAWESAPMIKVFKDGTEITGETTSLLPDLVSNYTIRVYHNMLKEDKKDGEITEVYGSKLVTITGSLKNNSVSFIYNTKNTEQAISDNEYSGKYLEFKITKNGTNLDTGAAIADTISFDIKYTLNSGEVVTKTLTKEIIFIHALPYSQEPEIKFYTSDNKPVDDDYIFDRARWTNDLNSVLNDIRIRLYPHINPEFVGSTLKSFEYSNTYGDERMIYQTAPANDQGTAYLSNYELCEIGVEYTDDTKAAIDYIEYRLYANGYIPEGFQTLVPSFTLNYISKETSVLQSVTDKVVSKPVSFNAGIHEPAAGAYWLTERAPKVTFIGDSTLTVGIGSKNNPYRTADLGTTSCVAGVQKSLYLSTWPNFYNNVKVSKVSASFRTSGMFNVVNALADSGFSPSRATVIFYPKANLEAGTYTNTLKITVTYQHTFSEKIEEAFFELPISIKVSAPIKNSKSGTVTKTSGCFDAGTPVLLADGTYKNIENIKPGDTVRSYNISTCRFEESVVLTRHKFKVNDGLVLLTFADGTKLYTTTVHPFYTTTGWVSLRPSYHYNMYEDISDDHFEMMKEGQKFYKVNNKTKKIEFVELVRIQYRHGLGNDHCVYNLDVSGNNTFFAGDILGHNEKVKANNNTITGGSARNVSNLY